MNDTVYRYYVEKKPGFDIQAKSIQDELAEIFKLSKITLRLFNRYDIQNISQENWHDVINIVLSEPASDLYYKENLPNMSAETRLLYVEPLPGQFDIRGDSCEQCIQMLLGGERPVVRTAKVYAIDNVDNISFEKIKNYLINPLECRIASAEKPETLFDSITQAPENIPIIKGFSAMDTNSLEKLRDNLEMAMSVDDLLMISKYFAAQNREPTETELRVLDTYWSDHCRHTTFNTIIDSVDIQDERIQKAYDLFLSKNGDKPVTFMNMATAAMRYLRGKGELPMLDVSDENNACTLRIKAEFTNKQNDMREDEQEDGQKNGREDWLLFFKNETHNHPTEIEPFGGASTCIGGAIRDPLSGRAYVYQGMRITGSGDPRKPFEDTLSGKLPQRKLTTTAAEGFSSYGNQIGLATGYVKELYHEKYIAKRLEAGAVVGAAPTSWVRRDCPSDGDIVVLLGGKTGRDGIGGATGSSKTHGIKTVSECASEVQKGNAAEERKLQRLFRNPNVTKLIKKCNDFGAGGAAVAIGELADGVEINLDAIPVKYQGLNGTELAISESQERMAVVIDEKDLQTLTKYTDLENIEASVVAKITAEKRLVMTWRNQKIVDIERAFLDTNGTKRYASVYVPKANSENLCRSKNANTQTQTNKMSLRQHQKTSVAPSRHRFLEVTLEKKILQLVSDINFCSQKGLIERFDSSIGAKSVLMPFGGKYQLTETQVMAAILPKEGAKTASVMAYGFDPHFTEEDPFLGSVFAVLTSAAKLIAAGVSMDTIHLSLQEFFPRLNDDPLRWGKPFSAMLGAFSAQMGLKLAAIGGKDSMSGSFGNLDVPSTLISFATGVANADVIISPEFKEAGNFVYLLQTPLTSDGLPDYSALLTLWEKYTKLCADKKILSSWVCENGGVYGGIIKMSLGNMLGFKQTTDEALENTWGSIIFESKDKLDGFKLLGHTQDDLKLKFGEVAITLEKIRTEWEKPLENVFNVRTKNKNTLAVNSVDGFVGTVALDRPQIQITRPKVVIPIFPGTNCEYDTAAAIEKAGGEYEFVHIRNLTPNLLQESVKELEKAIKTAQILVFPGGFSGGDEPDGSGKFIVSLFRNPRLTDAIHDLLQNKDGLILGICNGFQALIKLGLLPFGVINYTSLVHTHVAYGKIQNMTENCPTLTFNTIGRHQAKYITTRISSNLSPWLVECNRDELYTQPISHGEGRFIASLDVLENLKANGQIAFQYVDFDGVPSMDITHNPNGSLWAIEGICSPDGRILGKMAHTERCGEYTAINIKGNKNLPLFKSGINYFKI